jgi:hypothetical protein
MTRDRDPFELLPNFVDPEPDTVVMHATIAQSRDAFANRRLASHAKTYSVFRWFGQSARWLMPVGVGVAALIVALVVAPGLLPTTTEIGKSRDMVADAPAAKPPGPTTLSRGDGLPADETPSNSGTRMGMQPGPGATQAPVEAVPQTISRLEGDGVVIGTRLDATGMEIFLPEISGEQTIDVQGVMPGEAIELLSAFAQPDNEVVAVQFRVNDVRFWRIYHLVDGRYARDPQRSQRVSNAADRADVERRLAEPAG